MLLPSHFKDLETFLLLLTFSVLDFDRDAAFQVSHSSFELSETMSISESDEELSCCRQQPFITQSHETNTFAYDYTISTVEAIFNGC